MSFCTKNELKNSQRKTLKTLRKPKKVEKATLNDNSGSLEAKYNEIMLFHITVYLK